MSLDLIFIQIAWVSKISGILSFLFKRDKASRFIAGNLQRYIFPHIILINIMYRYKIGDFNLLPIYLGGTFESGNVWEDKAQINFSNTILVGSMFLGLDSFLGPVYIGYGNAEGDNQAVYFYLGKRF